MTRDEAVKLIQNFYSEVGVQSSGLNANDLGGAQIEDLAIYFEYVAAQGRLNCSALIYKFHNPIKPALLEGFWAEEASGTPTGGGKVDYQDESKGLFLTRTYTAAVPDAQFRQEMVQILEASRVWTEEIFERVTQRVFHPEEAASS